MPSRRTVLQASGAAALLAPFPGFAALPAAADGAPVFAFGVLADPQFADLPPRGERFYANSLAKLAAAVTEFNARDDLAFVVTLGDVIDGDWPSFDAILPVYRLLRAPPVFVLGNHDFAVAPEHLADVPGRLGLPRGYYDFSGGGYRFVVLDGNEISVFANPEGSPRHRLARERLAALAAAGAPNATAWNAGMSDEQHAWLAATLARAADAGEKVVVFGHYVAHVQSRHTLWDHERLLDSFAAHAAVQAYFNGHDHRGGYGEIDGRHFVNFRGMVDTEHDPAFAIVEVHADRIEILGRGREPSRTLALAGAAQRRAAK